MLVILFLLLYGYILLVAHSYEKELTIHEEPENNHPTVTDNQEYKAMMQALAPTKITKIVNDYRSVGFQFDTDFLTTLQDCTTPEEVHTRIQKRIGAD